MQKRYNTRASEFYRLQLRSISENIPFNDQAPNYETGREVIPPEELRQAEMNMATENQGNRPLEGDDSLLSSGYSLLSIAAHKLTENAHYTADLVKQQADQTGVTQTVNSTASTLGQSLFDMS